MTLIEVLLSAAILAILMGGMASAVALASRAIPRSSANASVAQVQGSIAEAMEQMDADLAVAKTITQLTPTAITMTVADRGHGAAGDETIRYSWTGVAGDPLTRTYNGGTAVTLLSGVKSFALTGTIGAGTLSSAPRVMLVVGNAASLGTEDTARVGLLTLWQFPTTIVDAAASAAAYQAAAVNCDVMWVSEQSLGSWVVGKLSNPSIGIVNEDWMLVTEFGFAALNAQTFSKNISVTSTSHPITSVFPLGTLKLSNSAAISMNGLSGVVAPGATVLGVDGTTGLTSALACIDVGGMQISSRVSRGRRVSLPIGGTDVTHVSVAGLTSDGTWLIKRSLVWAAAPVVYQRVDVTIQAGAASTVKRTFELLNQPGVAKP